MDPHEFNIEIGQPKNIGDENKIQEHENEVNEPERAEWGNKTEFLMSCIAASVGLGNVWRFPFVAYQNGGGAFLIPYITVLLLVGKPLYYVECALGQFSNRNPSKLWSISPAMRGIGYSQCLLCSFILSYYVSIIALCVYYLEMSFQSPLPWALCDSAWSDVVCVPSAPDPQRPLVENATSSAELYFTRTVLRQSEGIQGGIGSPLWDLTLCLLASWFIIFMIVARGVKSSGKASYFLAIFPYVVLITLLISTCLLEGAADGILFFITPQWDKLLELDVWYAAITQMFFSLSVSTGILIMYSSYNKFDQNVYRLLFSVLFFLMMSVLGIGSGIAFLSMVNSILLDAFPNIPTIYISAFSCSAGFLAGLVYVTPGGQYILEIVDYYGGTFLALFCGIVEVIGLFWIYGLENICLDIEFMLGVKTGAYWRLCWGAVIPFIMIGLFLYALVSFEALVFGGYYVYPTAGYVSGYIILVSGMVFVPCSILLTLWKNKTGIFSKTVKKSFHFKNTWGPRSPVVKREWQAFRLNAKEERQQLNVSRAQHIWYSLTGGYAGRLRKP